MLATTSGNIYVGFVQHEPGPNCSSLIDVPFADNLRACQRYFAKSNAYATVNPTSNDWRGLGTFVNTNYARVNIVFPVEMAKAPTMTIYDNGVNANAIYSEVVGSIAVTSVGYLNSHSCGHLATATPGTNPIAAPVLGQWRADTGW
jgi:hypothetical protein